MIYNLSTQLDRERFAARTNALLQKGSVIELTEKMLRMIEIEMGRIRHLL